MPLQCAENCDMFSTDGSYYECAHTVLVSFKQSLGPITILLLMIFQFLPPHDKLSHLCSDTNPLNYTMEGEAMGEVRPWGWETLE